MEKFELFQCFFVLLKYQSVIQNFKARSKTTKRDSKCHRAIWNVQEHAKTLKHELKCQSASQNIKVLAKT